MGLTPELDCSLICSHRSAAEGEGGGDEQSPLPEFFRAIWATRWTDAASYGPNGDKEKVKERIREIAIAFLHN
jgi:hypothetical protein